MLLSWSTLVLLLAAFTSTSCHRNFLEYDMKDRLDSLLEGSASNSVEGQMDGEGTRRKRWAEIETICNCFRTGFNSCSANVEDYGPIVFRGQCMGGINRRRRRDAGRGDIGNIPMILFGELICQGSEPLIFASSGTERHLSVGSSPSVIICPGSISPHLEELKVSDVQEIIVAPGALMPRDSNIVLNFTRIKEKIILPEEAFTVESNKPRLSHLYYDPKIDEERLPPAVVQLLIESAKEVEFKSRSIVAPRISISLREVNHLTIGPRAIIPYSHPEVSSLKVSHSHVVMMENQAISTGDMNIMHVQHLILKESSAEVVTDGEVHLEDISSAVLQDNALALSPGVSLKLHSVNISSAGHRSIHNYNTSSGSLLNTRILNVIGSEVEPGAFCLETEFLDLDNLDLDWRNDQVAACIEANMTSSHKSWNAGVVVCHDQLDRTLPCSDDRCLPCLPRTAVTTEITEPMMKITSEPKPTSESSTTFPTYSSSSEMMSTNEPMLKEAIILDTTTITGTINGTNSTDHSVLLRNVGGLPLYAVILAIFAGIITTLLISYCISKFLRRNKHATYKLSHAVPKRTFQKNIVTAENLNTLNRTVQPNCSDTPAEMYITFNASQPLNEMNTRTTDAYAPSTDFHTLPANAYLPPADTYMAPDGDHTPATEAYMHPADAYTPFVNTTAPPATNISVSNSQMPSYDVHNPPADNYILSANDHIPLADSNIQHI
ncbi:uncharacterized protein [Panulirus ornatus]|uniref:uncharacterized protein isoform X2 n=1 Tax=Panulirus ornatus TaxID=150431 RepID=UPI003A865B0A